MQRKFESLIPLASNASLFENYKSHWFGWAQENLGVVFFDDIGSLSGALTGYSSHVSDSIASQIVENQKREIETGKSERKQVTDLLYDLAAISEELVNRSVSVVMTSTRLTAFRVLLDAEKYSRERIPFSTFSEIPPITLAQIMSFLSQ